MAQFMLNPARTAKAKAPSVKTGKVPGCPAQTGQSAVLGFVSSLTPLGQVQNNLVLLASWTWISNPITGSNWVVTVYILLNYYNIKYGSSF